MNTWEDNLYGFVRKEDWLDIGSIVPTRQNDPIDRLFGDTKTNNLVAKWESIAAEYGIPVMAQYHGFDTEANTTFRIPIDNRSIEKGLIKVKINQSERLRALTRSGVVGDQELYNYVLDDGARLADQVITRTKVAKNELMAYGKVTIKENGLEADVIYACGPMPMLRAIKAYASEKGMKAYISLEERMACGVGACLGCICKTKEIDEHSQVKNTRICTDGPVFDADDLDM